MSSYPSEKRMQEFYNEYIELKKNEPVSETVYQMIADKRGMKASTVKGYILEIAKKYKEKGEAVLELRDPEEIKLIKDIRAQKDALESTGINAELKHLWLKNKNLSGFYKVKDEVKTYDEIRDDLIRDMDEHSPNYTPIKRKPIIDPHMFLIDPADIHFGKRSHKEETGHDYTEQITFDLVTEGIDGLLNKVWLYSLEKIVLVVGNDILHTDNARSTTTSGTFQDSDGSWWTNFQMAKKFYVETIEKLLEKADVHIVYCPSNHDYTHGYFLADSLASHFRRSKNISFDKNIAHRKYFHYGLNLIGATHGDGAKETELPDLMKSEAKKAWAHSKYGYWFTHHFHHKTRNQVKGKKKNQIEKDYADVTVIGGSPVMQEDHCLVEYLRSPSPADSWHHRNGFQHAPMAIEGFIFHPEYGNVHRITHNF